MSSGLLHGLDKAIFLTSMGQKGGGVRMQLLHWSQILDIRVTSERAGLFRAACIAPVIVIRGRACAASL